jgi:hypothetical protein
MKFWLCSNRLFAVKRIGLGAEIRNVRNALLFVNHQIFYDRKILARGLLPVFPVCRGRPP